MSCLTAFECPLFGVHSPESAVGIEWGAFLAQVLQNLFIGFAPTFVGSIAGAVWAFVNGFIAGALIAFFYNRFLLVRRPQTDDRGQSGS